MKVGILGYGNVGWHFVRWFSPYLDAIEVVTKYPDPEITLAPTVRFLSSLTFLSPDLDLVFLTVKDDHIETVAQALQSQFSSGYQPVVVHTSGTVSWNRIAPHFEYCGVFYPFQTFTRGIPIHSYREIPIVVDGSSSHVRECLVLFCDRLHNPWYLLNEIQRQYLHLAGVFANNFVNVLETAAEEILSQIPLPRTVLKPLLAETIRKFFLYGGAESQTGPAKRNDQNTLGEHIRILSSRFPHLQQVYQNLSSLIQYYQEGKRS